MGKVAGRVRDVCVCVERGVKGRGESRYSARVRGAHGVPANVVTICMLSTLFDQPKSVIFITSSSPSRMFEGVTSRCITFCSCT